uniref:EGF-like domain-containing protein n=1 Tax=Chrysotila carterae TaxID=13221 RepID=A0A6T0AP85_CHRCT
MPAKKMTLLALTGLLNVAMAHVRLNWPPAQHPSDFLDNIRTPDPCGLGEPNENTVIRGGSSIVVEWHLGYAHYGGHELQIINRSSSVDENGECFYPVLAQLTNFTANELQDASTHSMEVEIPTGLGCGADSQCALRLIRSASEWGSTAAPYNFLSCSSVEIVDDTSVAVTPKPDLDECKVDADCGADGRGLCVDIDGTTAPQRQCFCKAGFHGDNCAQESQLTADFDTAAYEHSIVDGDFEFYWTIQGAAKI